jgi:hypothetical protein
MIISHKHRYVFIENPQTASWAIRNELCEYYSGSPILHKHATVPEFHRSATPEERKYFVFITVRNPLDVLVSRYFKYKTDHDGAFSNPAAIDTNESDYSDQIKYEFIRETNASFEDYFLNFYKRPYSDLADFSSRRYDVVIHFERLQNDFSTVLRRLGIDQVRPVPMINQTRGKKREWISEYTPAMIPIAKRVCGPFMEKWGYDFPPAWGPHTVRWIDRLEYGLVSSVKNAYIHHFRNNTRGYAKLVRRLRASLIN